MTKSAIDNFKVSVGTSEENLNAILSALNKSVLVSITDAHGRITYANDMFVNVSKYDREELIGENHRIIKSGFHSIEFYKGLWSAISSGHVWRGEIKNQAKDGTLYWVDSNISPIIDEFGKIQGYIAIRFLITDKKQLQEKLIEKNKELNETLEDFYTLRMGMLRDVEKKELEDENIKIRERIDQLNV